MRVVQVERFGGPEVLRAATVTDPEPGPGEAEVAVTAADVMFLDTLRRSGWDEGFFPVRPPYAPGSGVVGRVDGSRVVVDTKKDAAGSELPVGGYAERAVAPCSELIPVPDALTDLGRAAFSTATRRGIAVTGLADLPRLDRARRRALVERTLAEAAEGRYRPVIGQTFPLGRAADAHAAIAARETVGKTLLVT